MIENGSAGATRRAGASSLTAKASAVSRLEDLPEPPPWAGGALCAQTDPEIFFPEKGGSTLQAKSVCRGCEVRKECLAYALEHVERYGIWGGLSERQRRPLLPPAPKHGLSDEDRATRHRDVARLHAENLPDTVIAERLGLSLNVIGGVRKVLSLPRVRNLVPKPGRGVS